VIPFAIEQIRNSQDQVIYQAKPLASCPTCPAVEDAAQQKTHAPRAISSQNAFLITSALHDALQHGALAQARTLQRKDLAGKTGTTQNQVDAWFAGYSTELVAISWLGYDQQQRSLH